MFKWMVVDQNGKAYYYTASDPMTVMSVHMAQGNSVILVALVVRIGRV